MLIDLPQNVLKAMLMFASPLDILRLRRVCFHLFNFIKVCRRQLPMPEVEALQILAPSTDDPDNWKFHVDTLAKPDEQESDERKVHGINSLNLPIEENFKMDCFERRCRSRSCTVPTSRLNEMVQELCQFRHSRLHIGGFDKKNHTWTDLGFLLQMLNDVYGECPMIRPDNINFQWVNLTTVPMVDWRTFLARMNTQGNKRYFEMIWCTIPHLDYGLPSISTSRLLNSIDQYCEWNNFLTGTEQPDLSQTMDVLLNLMLRSPGMDAYKYIRFNSAALTASQWIGLIETWQNGVERVAVDCTAAKEEHCSLFMKPGSFISNGDYIFRKVAQHFNCELAYLVIDKPRSKQLLIFYVYNNYISVVLLRFAQPWNRQQRTLIQQNGWYLDKWIDDSLRMPSSYSNHCYLAIYRRMKELGIMTEKDRRFMSGEEEEEPLEKVMKYR